MTKKVLAFSDIHGRTNGLRYLSEKANLLAPDIVVISGDITDLGNPVGAFEALTRLSIPVVVIPGNMDNGDSFPALTEGRSNIHYVHGRREEIHGIGFVGFGVMRSATVDISEVLTYLVKEGDYLITHIPSRGHNDRVSNGDHVGSRTLARLIARTKPAVHHSGHIHESPGISREGPTLFVNPGPAYEERCVMMHIGDEVTAEEIR